MNHKQEKTMQGPEQAIATQVAAPPSPVDQALQCLNEAIAEYTRVMAEITGQLDSVLTPEPQPEGEGKDCAGSCPLSVQLHQKADTINLLNASMSRLINRLEL